MARIFIRAIFFSLTLFKRRNYERKKEKKKPLRLQQWDFAYLRLGREVCAELGNVPPVGSTKDRSNYATGPGASYM